MHLIQTGHRYLPAISTGTILNHAIFVGVKNITYLKH